MHVKLCFEGVFHDKKISWDSLLICRLILIYHKFIFAASVFLLLLISHKPVPAMLACPLSWNISFEHWWYILRSNLIWLELLLWPVISGSKCFQLPCWKGSNIIMSFSPGNKQENYCKNKIDYPMMAFCHFRIWVNHSCIYFAGWYLRYFIHKLISAQIDMHPKGKPDAPFLKYITG